MQVRGAHKEVKFSNEGRAAMLKGVDVLAKAVSVTLGPKGSSFLLTSLLFRRLLLHSFFLPRSWSAFRLQRIHDRVRARVRVRVLNSRLNFVVGVVESVFI